MGLRQANLVVPRQLMEAQGRFGPRDLPSYLFLMFEEDESLLPVLRQYAFQPSHQIFLRIVGSAQAQVPPTCLTDDPVGRRFVGVFEAQAAVSSNSAGFRQFTTR